MVTGKAKESPLKEVAARAAFSQLDLPALRLIAAALLIALGEAKTLFQVLMVMVKAILKVSESDALGICKTRLASSVKRKDTAGAGDGGPLNRRGSQMSRERMHTYSRNTARNLNVTRLTTRYLWRSGGILASHTVLPRTQLPPPQQEVLRRRQSRGTCLLISTSRICRRPEVGCI